MFQSATLKLTAWYLLLLSAVGVIFSIFIFQAASAEIDARLQIVEERLFAGTINTQLATDFARMRNIQATQAEKNLLGSLIYLNLFFLALGGVAAFFLARRTLAPIEQYHEAQSRFTSDASHELRTPLAAMKTELEVALRDPKITKSEMKSLLSSNLEEVDKLSKISQSLLLLSRLEHSSLPTRRFAMDDIIRRVVESHNRKQNRIEYTPPKKPLYIAAHQVSIEELAAILIDNALKYSKEGTPVSVNLTKKGRKARMDVKNEGKGISPEDLPYIFERFYRADESRTNGNETGFGLGLSLAKKIVEVHKGDLSVSSEPGKVTVFTVSLPLHESPTKKGLKPKKQHNSRGF